MTEWWSGGGWEAALSVTMARWGENPTFVFFVIGFVCVNLRLVFFRVYSGPFAVPLCVLAALREILLRG
ncbi:MAG TPA: hypothetical protein VIH58_02940 [Chthoniobacterales bacterium]